MSVDPVLLQDAQKLTGADGLVELFEIQLKSAGVIYLKPDNTAQYQGNTYEGAAIQITGIGQNADGSVSRPTLTFQNLDGAFSAPVGRGELDMATVIYRKVLKTDFDANVARYTEQSWLLTKVTTLTRNVIAFELRGFSDAPYFQIPPRMFMPPEFPAVSLQ